MPVVASLGTTTVRLVPSAATVAAVALLQERLPLVSMALNSSFSPAASPVPASVRVCPTLAEAIPTRAGVPVLAVAVAPLSRLSPVPKRSSASW